MGGSHIQDLRNLSTGARATWPPPQGGGLTRTRPAADDGPPRARIPSSRLKGPPQAGEG
jgi:hypothetical protein